MMNKELIIFGGISVLATVFGLVATITAKEAYDNAKDAMTDVNRLCKRLNASLDDLDSRTTISVSDEIINNVVEEKAQRTFDKVIPPMVDKEVTKIKNETMDLISESIKTKVDEYGPTIRDNLKKQVGEVSIEKEKARVLRTAVDEAKMSLLKDLKKEKDEAIDAIYSERRTSVDEISDKCDELKTELENKVKDKVDDLIDGMEDMVEKKEEELDKKADEKFNDLLDSASSSYKNRMYDMDTIYSAFAGKMRQ